MAEQLAENYHNAWAKRKKLELESRGTLSLCQQPPDYRSLLHFCTRVHLIMYLTHLHVQGALATQ